MHAENCPDGTIAVSGIDRIEQFTKIWAGIGWPEREPGHFCVVGERTDGRYHALWEMTGGLWELGDSAVQAKDRFLIEGVWVDARDTVATSYFRTLDGLCFYGDDADRDAAFVARMGLDAPKQAYAKIKPTATVMPVPERVSRNYRSALEKVRGVILRGALLVHETNCPKIVYAIRQPLEYLLTSSAMKGLVWVLTALEESKGNGSVAKNSSDPWYGNLPREID
ncbi:MAG: hypothetical protein HY914_05080 [Desulfomonile tiedjei]|nr:hypothetical protein [Desulfomonile tiedjei]